MNPPSMPGRRPWSMTARLCTLQVLATAVLIGGALGTLYSMVASHLEADNHELLNSETAVISGWLTERSAEPANDTRVQDERTRLISTLPEIYVRLSRPDGGVLLASPSSRIPPTIVFPPADAGPALSAWRSPERRRFLLKATRLQPALGSRSLILQVAYDVSDDDKLLHRLRERMLLVFGLILVLSWALSLLIARSAFRPLAALTTAIGRVQASELKARVDESGWPAELTSLAGEFDAMLVRLAESFHRLTRFSSDLSHELRTPINNLRGEAEVALSRTRSPEEYRRVLESNLEECARLGRLIDTLLFIAKSDNPERVIVRRELDAGTECQAVVDFFEAMTSERNLSMLVRGTGRIYADPELLRRALVNLVDNAVRHTAPGGHVDLAIREGTDHGTEIEVSDNGAGIPSAHLPRVFERFYRSEKSPGEAHATTGFGLGLAIVKSIMDLHDGTVVITSAVGTGTAITLRFPRRS